MHQTTTTRRTRSKQDRRAHTPEARAIREERRQRRSQATENESDYGVCAYWLNDFMSSRQDAPATPEPARPYPLGRLHARRFLNQVINAHRAMRAGF